MRIPIIGLTISGLTLLAAGLTAGVLMAQTPAPVQGNAGPNPVHRRTAGSRQQAMLQRMTAKLNLTPNQQDQVKAILNDSRQQAKGLTAQFRQERKAIASAVKSDSEQQIDQITQQNAKLNSQMEAIHLRTIAKVYAILTPDQKAKFDQRFGPARGVRPASGA